MASPIRVAVTSPIQVAVTFWLYCIYDALDGISGRDVWREGNGQVKRNNVVSMHTHSS